MLTLTVEKANLLQALPNYPNFTLDRENAVFYFVPNKRSPASPRPGTI